MAEGQEGQVAAPEAPGITPTPIIGEDGIFAEDWTLRLKDESLHDDPTLKTIKDIDSFAKNHVLQRKKIGGNTVLVPSESSTEAELDAFYRAGGRPDTAADYNFVRPEDFPEEQWNDEFATKAQDILFKFGANKQLSDALLQLNLETILAGVKAQAEIDERDFKDAESALNREWGNAKEQNIHIGNVAIEKGTSGDADFKERIVKKFGNDPDFIKYSYNLGSKFSEHGIPIPGIPTPGDLKQQINDEIAKKSYGPDYIKHGFTRAQHRTQVELVARLHRDLVASTKAG